MVTTVVEPLVSQNAVVSTSTTANYTTSGNATGTFTYVSSTKRRTKTLNPDRFDQLKDNGFMPPMAYYAKKEVATLTPGTVVLKWPALDGSFKSVTNVDYMYCNPVSRIPFTHSAASKAVAAATANANARLRQQQMSLIEDVAEGRQTFKLIFGSMMNVYQSFRFFKKGQFKKGLRVLGLDPNSVKRGQSAAQAWLAYRYGLIPLMSEIHGAISLLHATLKETNVVRHVTGFGTSDVKVSTTSNSVARTGNHAFYGTLYYRVDWTGTFKCSVGHIYSIKNASVSVATQLGLTNPLLVAEELITLSFVVDWFLNVSDVLEQLDVWSASSWIAGFQTLKLTEDGSSASTSYTPPGWSGATGKLSNALSSYRKEEISRTVFTKPPTVGLVFRPNLNWKRLTDAAALLRMFSK